MYEKNNTIIAQATPIGRGGIGILRISGNQVNDIAKKILGKMPRPRYAEYTLFYNSKNEAIDQGILIWFPKPNSFTGEDVLEIHGHGGPFVLNLLLENIINIFKIRVAEPGEFSKRAFLNKKIDLNQAEAIFDLISASSEKEVLASMNSLQGYFSKKIKDILVSVIEIRTFIEASIDFLEEKISFKKILVFKEKIKKIILNLTEMINHTKLNSILETGIKIIIVGSPNVGKSSLFNILMKEEKSIVTNIAGTTRDIIEGFLYIDGIKFLIKDTAGLRKSDDKIEVIGISLTKKEIEKSDHIFYLIDGSNITIEDLKKRYDKIISNIFFGKKLLIIRNKIDLVKEIPSKYYFSKKKCTIISISAINKIGISFLQNYLKKIILLPNKIENQFLAKKRHLKSLERTLLHLNSSLLFLKKNNFQEELFAEELRLSQMALDEITGKFTSENLLDHIFKNFCIGK